MNDFLEKAFTQGWGRGNGRSRISSQGQMMGKRKKEFWLGERKAEITQKKKGEGRERIEHSRQI